MYIGLKNIQQLFSNFPNIRKESVSSSGLTSCILLKDAPTPYKTHLLYLYEYNESMKNLEFILGMHIICITDEQQNLEKIAAELPDFINIMLLKHKNPDEIYSQVLEYFSVQCGIGLFTSTMLDILSSEGGIQSMVDHAYSAFGNPIFVFDASFNLIAANWDAVEKINGAIDLIKNKGFSDKEFEMANSRNHIHARVLKSEVPILAHNPELGYDQLLCAIDTQKDLGHVVVSAINHPLSTIDSQLLAALKQSIDQQFKKDEFIRNSKGFNYEYFLRDLLDEKIAAKKPYLDRLDYVRDNFSGNMCCLVVDTAHSSQTLNTFHIRSILERHFPNSKTLVYNGEVIAILSMSQIHLFPKEHLSDAIKICKSHNLYAGLSNCFHNIIEIPQYYKQALKAIELGVCSIDEPNLFLYENYYLEHIKNIFLQKESSETFCHPSMKFLLNYDKKHDSELAYTLYMYLICERNLAKAAYAMHMHRNSLVYRIKKINSLIDNNYESYRERQYLILSYEINHPS